MFHRLRASNSEVNSPIWPRNWTCPRFYNCRCYLQVAKMKSLPTDNIFPIISLWELSVAGETRVLIQSVQKPYAAFTLPSDTTHKIWSRLANWP